MIDAVLLFGVINIAFEFVILGMIPPRSRLRLLGGNGANILHIVFLVGNLIVHWGTLIGTMSAILAFICSIVTVATARKLFGYITDDRYYTVGLIKYNVKDLK